MTSRSEGSNRFLSAAREFAERGWPVFPLVPRTKRPIVSNGVLQATTDRNQILEWWQFFPEANIGLATGDPVDVLDLDGPSGVPALQELLGTDFVHDGPAATTGKGLHLYFAHLPDSRNRAGLFGGKVDYRGAGGYVVAPPSIHPSGATYHWSKGRDARRPLPVVPEVLRPHILKSLSPNDKPTAAINIGGLRREDTGVELLSKGGIIIARPNIYQVVEHELNQVIAQHGMLWKTVCIFHPDRNPSMVLYPDDTFHCYACEAHGDSLDLQRGIDKDGRKRI
jgi:hypothetical protein